MIKNYRLARRWGIALLAALLLSGTAITLASPATLANLTGAGGSGYDPLNPGEQARVLQALVQTGALPQTARLPSQAESSNSVTDAAPGVVPGAPGEEVLLVERRQEDKQVYAQPSWPRRADVYTYRYADDTLIHQIYNLTTNQLEQVETVQGVQLPLTADESQRALAIALNDPALRPQLDAAFGSITNQQLTSGDQLEVKAMTFHADAAPGMALGAAAQCGVKRCAQLLLTAGDNVALQIIPIVDLSSGTVAQALPFNGAPQ